MKRIMSDKPTACPCPPEKNRELAELNIRGSSRHKFRKLNIPTVVCRPVLFRRAAPERNRQMQPASTILHSTRASSDYHCRKSFLERNHTPQPTVEVTKDKNTHNVWKSLAAWILEIPFHTD